MSIVVIYLGAQNCMMFSNVLLFQRFDVFKCSFISKIRCFQIFFYFKDLFQMFFYFKCIPRDMHLEPEVPASLKGNSSVGRLFSLSAKFRLYKTGWGVSRKRSRYDFLLTLCSKSLLEEHYMSFD